MHSHIAPTDALPPTPLASRPSIFIADRQVGVPPVDFAGLSADLAQMKIDAQTSGLYYAASGALGYHIILKTNDTLDIYRVDTYTPNPGCITRAPFASCAIVSSSLWSIGTQTLLTANVPFPANGIIFTEDHVWVNGQINTARLTITSARFPDNPPTRTNIIINDNLQYSNYDGQDALALIAQNDILLGLQSVGNQRIDAALIAQSGRLQRLNYNPSCGVTYQRTSAHTECLHQSTLWITHKLGVTSGYLPHHYDSNLLYILHRLSAETSINQT